MNKLKVLAVLLFCILLLNCKTSNVVVPHVNAHAHNDYEHKKPLFDALNNGFISVEADVHLINNELYVSHFKPQFIDSTKTLEAMYLAPLQKRINENYGSVYKGYDHFFYLMIDIKTNADSSYARLKKILESYKDIIAIVTDGKDDTTKPVKIVITGIKGRPYHQILADEPKYVSLDGRLKELGLGINAAVMPYISENYKNYFTYNGIGKPSEEEINSLKDIVSNVHAEGKKIRFWASPDNEAVWKFLLDNKVDLVNTDSLPQFNNFLKREHSKYLKK